MKLINWLINSFTCLSKPSSTLSLSFDNLLNYSPFDTVSWYENIVSSIKLSIIKVWIWTILDRVIEAFNIIFREQ